MANTNNMHGEPPRPNKKRKKRHRTVGDVFLTIGKVLGTMLLVGVTTGAILACFAVVYIQTAIIPKASLDIGDFTLDLATTMYYTDKSTGNLQELRTIYGGANRVRATYDQLPKYLIDATVAIEDKRFWDHKGVDWIRTASGVLAMFTGGKLQGGSTLTQQLIKNVTGEDAVTVQRKILEIFQALEFEKKYEKEFILVMYLNYIYLGARSDGVYTASYTYFGKDVSQLNLAECASLIGITNNPSIYGPYVTGRDADGKADPAWGRKNNAKRASDVIWTMLDQGVITQEEHDQAQAEIDAGLKFVKGEGEKNEETVYTWYEDRVIKDVIADLVATQGISEIVAENRVYYGGLKIETCLDPSIQSIVDTVYKDMTNLPYTSGSGQQLQSGITIVDPEGNVVAISGAMGEKTGSRILSYSDTKRSPGSAFKPLSVYAPAIDLGLINPASVLDDTPYQLNADGSGYPKNSYGSYKGRMTIRDGLTVSSNPLAIKELAELTPQASFDFLTQKLGFDLVENRVINDKVKTDIALAPLSMGALTDGVSVMEMASAYSTFSRGGTYLKARTYTRVYDADGNILLDNSTDRLPTQVIKSTTAWYINSMLKDVVSTKRVSGDIATGYNAIFDGMTIAGKTGSTDANKDRWFVGYTPYYTAAVWCGYDQPERIKTAGENPAAVLWKKVMSQVHEGLENKDFAKPDGAGEPTPIGVCADSGMLATNETCALDPRGSRIRYESFYPGDAPTQYCTVHGAPVQICKESPFLDANGAPIGSLYHLAREFCPEETRGAVSYMELDRDGATGAFAQDNSYTKAYLDGLGEAALCTVHTAAPVPIPYDPLLFHITDEATWPTPDQWPGFDATKPETWPNNGTTPPGGIPTDPINPGEEHIPGGETPPPTTIPPTTGPDESIPFVPVA